MSSIWYVICLISPGKNEEICLMLSIHSRVLTQREAAQSGLPALAGLIYLHHHAALWEDFNSHCLALWKKITRLIHKFSLLSAFPLASNPISVPLKVNYFFVSLSFQQRDGPFSLSMGSEPSCRSCSLLAGGRLSHPSSLLM